MLARLGAHHAMLTWEERRIRREVRATANRLANFDDANLRRSARAAVAFSVGAVPPSDRLGAVRSGTLPVFAKSSSQLGRRIAVLHEPIVSGVDGAQRDGREPARLLVRGRPAVQ